MASSSSSNALYSPYELMALNKDLVSEYGLSGVQTPTKTLVAQICPSAPIASRKQVDMKHLSNDFVQRMPAISSPRRVEMKPLDLSSTPCHFGVTCHGMAKGCPYLHSSVSSKSTECKFGLKCRYMGTTCIFTHPTPTVASVTPTLCSYGTKCRNKAIGCPLVHMENSQIPCRYGFSCLKKSTSCPFTHPVQTVCRYGSRCMNESCTFSHS